MCPFEYVEPLEPYQMYNIMMHTRSKKGTCNLKSINNSESTYGSLQAYYREGGQSTYVTSTHIDVTLMLAMTKSKQFLTHHGISSPIG